MTTRHDSRDQTVERCGCGHNKVRHEMPGFDGECIAEGCRCQLFDMRTHAPLPGDVDAMTISLAAGTVPAPAPAALTTVEQTIAAARAQLRDRRSALVVARIEHLTAELRNRVYAERNKVRDAEIEAQIKTLPVSYSSSSSSGGPQRERARPIPNKTCGECGKTGLSNVGSHRRHAHGYRKAAS